MLTIGKKFGRTFKVQEYLIPLRRTIRKKLPKFLVGVLLIIGITHFGISYLLTSKNTTHIDEKSFNKEENKWRKLIEELQRVKHSVLSELRELESERNKIQEEISGFQEKFTAAEKESKRAQSELESLKRQILQTKNEMLELAHQNPKMAPPARLLPNEEDNIEVPPPSHPNRCRMHSCFDYSRCSLTSQFPVYVYPPTSSNGADAVWPITQYVLDVSINAFLGDPYTTSDPSIACVYVLVIGEIKPDAKKDPSIVEHWLSSLPHWRGDGRNHIIVHLSRQFTSQNFLIGVNTGRAIVAQSSFEISQFRSGFDIILPSLFSTSERTQIPKLKSDATEDSLNVVRQVPVMRKYFITFVRQWPEEPSQITEESEKKDEFHFTLLKHLKEMESKEKHRRMYFDTKCFEDESLTTGFQSEWALCGTTEARVELLSKSTFTIIATPEDDNLLSTTLLATQLAESLYSGAVPVILGTQVGLPFSEHIDWTKAAILWPKARITEVLFLLSSYPHADIASLRRQGKFLYDTYFSTAKVILDAVLATVRTRLSIPPLAIQDEASTLVEHESYVFSKDVSPGDAQSEFAMPIPEGQIISAKFIRNFTCVTIDANNLWNEAPGPFHLFPSTPNDRILSSDAKFLGSSTGFQPVGQGHGGVGEVFQRALGGNVPREQFTIVMLTYEREEVLLQSLQRLKGLPYLNKVLVVWNSPEAPDDDLQWPDIEVEIVVVRPKRNSLNNRFLPYPEIQTDAVLSVDDDAHLRHDEILFGFRVWRECRNRIVGFPGRFHTWDITEKNWKYDSSYSCELSMVLTGAAFFHKYYMYMYSYWMPQEVRDKVDEYMNCEDIAMNFLVSHLTGMPPIKATSRWTFRCPGCQDALSNDQSHFEERHICINYFVKVFGYMPLLATQFRVDSILFKTRLPHDKQKCFKYI